MRVHSMLKRCSVLPLLLLAACSTARLEQFSQFAATGQTYTTALPKVLDLALESTIAANSSELVETRKLIKDGSERAKNLNDSDKEIQVRAEAFRTIKAQTNLLGNYFTALAALAGSDAGDGLAKSAQDAAQALSQISESASTLTIGKAPVKDVLGAAVPIAVAGFQRAKLEKVLKDTAGSVGRSIDVHVALLDRLGVVIREEQAVLMGNKMLKEVGRIYRDEGDLPDDWEARRAELLLKQSRLGELEEALKAAQKLKLAFVDLVENRRSSASLPLLLQDIQTLMALAERISGKSQTEGA
jgi:hypothetical protein